MPYIIKKVKESGKTGFKVCKKDNPKRCFSEHAMTEEKAKKQRTAIILSEMGLSRRKGGVGSEYDMKEEVPPTILKIKEALYAQGYDGEVFDLANRKPAPKKADWEKLYKECYKKKRPSPPKGSFVSGPEEAFRQLSMADKS